MATERDVVERYSRPTRWLHAGVYTTVLLLLATGVWLMLGKEGAPSPLSRLSGVADTRLHVWVGWAFTALLGTGIVTGRFPRHEGHFDPGQRIANIAMVLGLGSVTGSGIAMALLHGGPAFVWLVPLHRWSTYLLIPLLVGHIVIAAGVLPGYRGVWRSMHLGGRLRVGVARRVWPGWTERYLATRVRPRDPRDATPSGTTAARGHGRPGG
jgi:hypothetical protein